MKRKILFFDIDGTILPEYPNPIPDSTIKALRMAQANGHLTIINTGRTAYVLPPEILELNFDGYICGCGSNLYYHGEELLYSHIPHDLCMDILEKTRAHRIYTCFEARDKIYLDSGHHKYPPAFQSFLDDQGGTDIATMSQEELASLIFDKMYLQISSPQAGQEFLDYCKNYFTVIDRGDDEYELIQPQYSKATGIRFFAEKLGLSLDDCYAFGDSNNDLPMLQCVKHSVAMGNATPDILPYCSYQTTDILEDGIYNALRHFGLIG